MRVSRHLVQEESAKKLRPAFDLIFGVTLDLQPSTPTNHRLRERVIAQGNIAGPHLVLELLLDRAADRLQRVAPELMRADLKVKVKEELSARVETIKANEPRVCVLNALTEISYG